MSNKSPESSPLAESPAAQSSGAQSALNSKIEQIVETVASTSPSQRRAEDGAGERVRIDVPIKVQGRRADRPGIIELLPPIEARLFEASIQGVSILLDRQVALTDQFAIQLPVCDGSGETIKLMCRKIRKNDHADGRSMVHADFLCLLPREQI
jgi:hypothetical protein